MIIYYSIVIILAVILAFCFIDVKGKVVYFLLSVLMFLLFAFTRSNVDIGAYILFYDSIHSISDIGITDPGFGLLMLIAKELGMNYYGFLGFLGFIGIGMLALIFYTHSQVPAIVLALYFILDFSAEIIQIRAFIAEAIMYILMLNLIERPRFSWVRFFILLAIGMLFHSTCVFFSLLLLPQIIKRRGTLLTVVGIMCLAVPMAIVFLRIIPIPILREKLQYYVTAQRSSISIASILYVFLFLSITVFICHKTLGENDLQWQETLGKLLNIHIVSIIACVLLLYFSANFYRMLRTVLVVDTIVLGNYYYQTERINKQTQGLWICGIFFGFIGYEIVLQQYYTIMIENSFFAWILGTRVHNLL